MRSLFVLTAVALAFTAGSAHADTTTLYAGVVGGYSAVVGEDGGPDPFGVGIGARAGLTLPSTSVYVGGLFLFNLGQSASLGTAGAELSTNSLMLGGEAGYELSLGPLVLRPSLGLGLLSVSESVAGQVMGLSYEYGGGQAFYVSPGINALLKLGLLLGAELRYNAVAGEPADSVSALAMLGLYF